MTWCFRVTRSNSDLSFDSSQSASERQLRSLDLDSDLLSTYQELLSRVIYPDAELRPSASVLESNVLGQSGLWRFGISGDYPTLLATIDHQDGLDNLQEIIQAHKYWRKLGLMIDLVILNTKDTGYTHELNERIHHLNILKKRIQFPVKKHKKLDHSLFPPVTFFIALKASRSGYPCGVIAHELRRICLARKGVKRGSASFIMAIKPETRGAACDSPHLVGNKILSAEKVP